MLAACQATPSWGVGWGQRHHLPFFLGLQPLGWSDWSPLPPPTLTFLPARGLHFALHACCVPLLCPVFLPLISPLLSPFSLRIEFKVELETGATCWRRKAKWMSIIGAECGCLSGSGQLLLCTTCSLSEITSLSLPLVMYHNTTHVLWASTAFDCWLHQADRQTDRLTDWWGDRQAHTQIMSRVMHLNEKLQ